MKNTKRSITLKVLIGYVLIGLLVFAALWYIYPQLRKVLNPQESEQTTNRKLTYTSNALSYLYNAETIGRTAMATGSRSQFNQYTRSIDRIVATIDSLQEITNIKTQKTQLDSIKILLDDKTQNISRMVNLREEQYSRNYYDEALTELIKEDIYFEDYANDPRLDSLDAYSKKVVVDLMEYIRKDNADKDQSLTSMASSVRKTLAKIEARKKELELDIINRENTLFANDRDINLKIRSLLNELERESSVTAQEREKILNRRLTEITETLKIIGIISIILAIGFIILIFKDASRSQQYNKELKESNAIAQNLLKSREQLMATITHDMRTPLNSVIGFADLLKKTNLDTKQLHYLNTVQKSGDFILKLVNDLLEFSKLESGKIKLKKQRFNAKDLIEDVLTLSLPSPLKDGISLITKIPNEVDQLFISDLFRIKQILSNLITNAYKFTDTGTITIEASYLNNKLLFLIKDTGCGIPKDKQEFIFKEFVQADDNTQHKQGGFGLGLSISQRLTALLRGSLVLESKPGVGSTFTLTIPVQLADNSTSEKSSGVIAVKPKLPTFKNVLIIDDEPTQIELTKAALSNYELTLKTATNGKNALDILKEHQQDLILTDIQMPIMNGIEFIKSLKKQDQLQNIPVIALSGNATLKKSDYNYFGFTAYITKPFTPDTLIKTIKTTGKLITKSKTNSTSELPTPENLIYSLEQLKAFVGNDREALVSILDIFVANTRESLSKLDSTTEPEERQKIAHRMLPMIRQLEVEDLISYLEKVERPTFKLISEKERDQLVIQIKRDTQTLLTQIEDFIKA